MLNNSTNLGVDTMVKNKNDETCFHIACSKAQKKIVELIFNDKNLKEIDVTAKNNKGNCGLSLALLNKHEEVVNFILKHYILRKIKIEDKAEKQ